MNPEKDGASLHFALKMLGPLFRNAGVLQDRGHAPGDVPSGLA